MLWLRVRVRAIAFGAFGAVAFVAVFKYGAEFGVQTFRTSVVAGQRSRGPIIMATSASAAQPKDACMHVFVRVCVCLCALQYMAKTLLFTALASASLMHVPYICMQRIAAWRYAVMPSHNTCTRTHTSEPAIRTHTPHTRTHMANGKQSGRVGGLQHVDCT